MIKKILVIRFSSIGDIVLTSPVIRVLCRQMGAEVHFLTKESFAPIVQANPYVTRVITLTDDFDQMIRILQDQTYDYIIDLHHNVRTRRIKLALGRPSKSFHKLNFQKWLVVRFGINKLPDAHIVDRYLDTLSSFGAKSDGEGLDFFIPAGSEVGIEETFAFHGEKYVAFVIGAAHQTKCLTAEQITMICNQLNTPVVLLGGQSESPKADYIAAHTNATKVRNACGQFTIQQSASIINQAAAVITHDTGLMHIAAALKKPQVVVWGNTIPEFGMYPYYGKEEVKWISIERTDLKCRPCSKLGFQKCPKGHFKCILSHDTNNIAQAAISLF